MKKYISPFICGFGAAVLQVVPLIKSFSCCLIIPFAAFISLSLDQKANKNYSNILMSKAFVFGIIIGLTSAIFSTFFDILITAITKQNDLITTLPELYKMIENFPLDQMVKKEVITLFENVKNDLISYGFSWFYTITIFLNNVLVNTTFGVVGSLISASILNNRNKNLE
ncbi:MAG: hypothetical protein AB1695_09700 [Stygiobacter sp.]|uniref:DUF4199 domain-containing protein n=1 Tax=Stygiobacter electus TaxID=3032292 RepID=A0AAE3P022_9BACT|nr:hypothetical protein [Stygiobacter electus]MDF1610568.1 hypothetical protein [Stygiobacter electus]